MSVRREFRAAVIAALEAETDLAGVQILPGPPGENQNPREAVWVASTVSAYDWRSLGRAEHFLRNRVERITLTLKVNVYREAPDQQQAFADADERADEIAQAIEHAIAADPGVGGTVSHALVQSVDGTPTPAASGWLVDLTVVVFAENHP